jgi:site-specific DNA recombinase
VNKGNAQSASRNIPTELRDELVLSELEGRVFTPAKLREIVTVARRHPREGTATDRHKLTLLQAEIHAAEERLGRKSWMGAITLTPGRTAAAARATGEGPLRGSAGGNSQPAPAPAVAGRQGAAQPGGGVQPGDPGQAARSGSAVCPRLAVVDSVVVHGDTATIAGRHARLMQAIAGKKTGTGQVPTSIPDWRARRDSNP